MRTEMQMKFLSENLKRNIVGRYGLDTSGPGKGPVVGCCEHGNEHSGSIKGEEFLD
jgi:hypothetical protein